MHFFLKKYFRLKHDHIVTYYGSELNTTTGQLNIFCEYMPGGSLDKLIRTVKKSNSHNKGGLDLDTVRCYGYQILSGLVYLHGENIGKYFKRMESVHRVMEAL